MWQDISAQLEKLFVKVYHVDAHIPENWATEEQNNQQVHQAAKVFQAGLGNTKVNSFYLGGPMTLQDIKKEMQHTYGLMADRQI